MYTIVAGRHQNTHKYIVILYRRWVVVGRGRVSLVTEYGSLGASFLKGSNPSQAFTSDLRWNHIYCGPGKFLYNIFVFLTSDLKIVPNDAPQNSL